jgi:predicted RNase H-like HicB family nuclease
MKAQRYTITVSYSEADLGYIAQVPELAFCSAFGSTPREALDEVERAMAAWLEAARSEGKPLPEPRPAKADFGVD